MQAAPEANTWIKSNQSLLSIVVRLLKNSFFNLVRKMRSQSVRVDEESICEGKKGVKP
jgi:hypothetical protein